VTGDVVTFEEPLYFCGECFVASNGQLIPLADGRCIVCGYVNPTDGDTTGDTSLTVVAVDREAGTFTVKADK
jgi:hypothetical protein